MTNILPSEIKTIDVFTGDFRQGLLTRSSQYTYQAAQEERFISLTMTEHKMEPFHSNVLHPIFSQNLPEGHNRHFISEKLARYAKVDEMYLLALQADYGIGMISYKSVLVLDEAEPLNLSDILNYQDRQPLFPQLLERYYLRNALSGVQPKVSVPNVSTGEIINNNAYGEMERTIQQKDLIIKTSTSELELLTVNEFVCMEAARSCGLQPPPTYLSNNTETYIIERFDKAVDGTKLGFEDFTTLMKRSNDVNAKYQGSYEYLLKATYHFTLHNYAELVKMYKYIVFNCLIGNGDAHLKNFALQYDPEMREIYVSPPFDITHTLIYEDLDRCMALKMNDCREFPSRAELIKLANNDYCRIINPQNIIDEISTNILSYLRSSNEVGLFNGLRESIEGHVNNTMRSTGIIPVYRHTKRKKYK